MRVLFNEIDSDWGIVATVQIGEDGAEIAGALIAAIRRLSEGLAAIGETGRIEILPD
jgi:hypothetical protein